MRRALPHDPGVLPHDPDEPPRRGARGSPPSPARGGRTSPRRRALDRGAPRRVRARPVLVRRGSARLPRLLAGERVRVHRAGRLVRGRERPPRRRRPAPPGRHPRGPRPERGVPRVARRVRQRARADAPRRPLAKPRGSLRRERRARACASGAYALLETIDLRDCPKVTDAALEALAARCDRLRDLRVSFGAESSADAKRNRRVTVAGVAAARPPPRGARRAVAAGGGKYADEFGARRRGNVGTSASPAAVRGDGVRAPAPPLRLQGVLFGVFRRGVGGDDARGDDAPGPLGVRRDGPGVQPALVPLARPHARVSRDGAPGLDRIRRVERVGDDPGDGVVSGVAGVIQRPVASASSRWVPRTRWRRRRRRPIARRRCRFPPRAARASRPALGRPSGRHLVRVRLVRLEVTDEDVFRLAWTPRGSRSSTRRGADDSSAASTRRVPRSRRSRTGPTTRATISRDGRNG